MPAQPAPRHLVGVALVSCTLLMTELALTRIFSVVMYYHFAFLAISIALFGVSASGVFAFVGRRWFDGKPTDRLLTLAAFAYVICTVVALFYLVRLRVGLSYSPKNLALMLTIYALASLPFFSGGLVVTLAIARLSAQVNAIYAADLIGAAAGCLLLIPLLDRLGASGVVLTAAALALLAACLFSARVHRARTAIAGAVLLSMVLSGQLSGVAGFDVVDTKGHQRDRVLFSKWNSFSRIGVYERTHGDWSLSNAYRGPLPDTRYMDIDSAASTPILGLKSGVSGAQYLRYELTAVAYNIVAARAQPAFSALVIGPGGGRDLASALVFGASHVDGVEINPIIANDVMRGRFRDFSGGIYENPRVHITIDDGRSFVRRTDETYDVIQASLVDTWAATAAGAYTLTENTLYTVDAFSDYLDHLNDAGMLSITRWVADGLRLVSLAQAACDARGWSAADRLAILRQGRVATFLLKKSPFTRGELGQLRDLARRMEFDVIYSPDGGEAADEDVDGTSTADYARLIRTGDRAAFYRAYHQDIRPTTDNRPFFFHTTKLQNQFDVAFGRTMLFGNGLSALITLLGISVALVLLFVIGPLAVAGRGTAYPRAWLAWLVYFGALGAGFMLIEVSVLQRFVLLLGHPVYSLTVTLFSLLLGTGLGAAASRRFDGTMLGRAGLVGAAAVAACALLIYLIATPIVTWAIPFARSTRMVIAAGLLVPLGLVLGVPMPTGLRLLADRAPQMIPWAWGINGAMSVLGATLAIFIAMNWGFQITLLSAAAIYGLGSAAFSIAAKV